MDTTSSAKKPSVAIIYGFSEGSLTGRRLREQLKSRNYSLIIPEQADIIISHSGGFLLLPDDLTGKTLIYVGANTWHMPLLTSLKTKLRYDFNERRQHKQLGQWFLHGVRNLWYIPSQHTLRLAKVYRTKPLPPITAQTIVLRNQHDPYCDSAAALRWGDSAVYVSLPGGHDDIWDNPSAYVDVIQSVYRG
jgi:pimeloyl-ACP methyl ester carboxylesterase